MNARHTFRFSSKRDFCRVASIVACFALLGCQEEGSTEAPPCEGTLACATKTHADNTVPFSGLLQFFTIVDPSGKTDYGQPDCPGYYVLDITRAPSDGNIFLRPSWPNTSSTVPCDFHSDFMLFGLVGAEWSLIGRTALRSALNSTFCKVEQVSRCGAGQDQYDTPGLVSTDARYSTLRAVVSIVDGQGKPVAVKMTGETQ